MKKQRNRNNVVIITKYYKKYTVSVSTSVPH